MTITPEQSDLEGHGICDLWTEFAQKQRSTSGHHDEEYEPSSEDPQWPPRGANRHAWRTLTYANEFLEKNINMINISGKHKEYVC